MRCAAIAFASSLRYDNGFAVGERDPNFNGITGTSTPPPAAAAEEQNAAP